MATPAERVSGPNVHAANSVEVCEWCEQPIPLERISEVRGRIAARELRRSHEISARMREQFARERSEDAARANAQLDAVRAEALVTCEGIRADGVEREKAARAAANAAAETAANEARLREAAIREEAQQSAERTIEERLAAELEMRDARESVLRGRVGELEMEQQNGQIATSALAAELANEKSQRAAELEAANRAGEALAASARQEATRAAQAEVFAAEQRAAQAEQKNTELRSTAANEKALAIAELTADLAKADEQRILAETAHRESQQTIQSLKASQEMTLQQRLQEQREALAKDKDKAVLETESRTFNERQKLQITVQDLTRQLEKMTAHERGEGAEISLYDALKGAFESDRIKRVAKGVAGADIIHEIVRHGKVCGRIIYDSKNRNDYKTAYASKLRADQVAAKAEFAVLSSNHFPASFRQLHLHEGVIVACPARVVTIAQMLRRHILQLHELRLSNEAREAKTEALYKFITSEPCRQLLETVDKLVADLLELDVSEQKNHKAVWERRGKMLTCVLRAHGDLCSSFDRIIGTAD
jgi:hypothetical protein